MTIEPTPSLRMFVPAALAASRVGTWEYDVGADLLRCDDTMAELYGLPVDENGPGIRLGEVQDIIHPEDLARHTSQRRELMQHGGLFVMEYRIRPRPGLERWVLVRGRYETDARTQGLFGRGIAIDVTESKQDGYAEGRAHFLISDPYSDAACHLDRAAELALRTRQEIDALGGQSGTRLRACVDALLMELGLQIASRLGGADDLEDGADGESAIRH